MILNGRRYSIAAVSVPPSPPLSPWRPPQADARIVSVLRIFLERRDMDDELRRLFDRLMSAEHPSASAECTPPIDVFDTPEGIEAVIDLPGVAADQVQVVIAHDTLVVMGHKAPSVCEHHDEAAFHVAERAFGRFARSLRLAGAFDVGRGTATLRDGELRVTLPRIEERRGRERRIPVRTL
jgi:HSP20 family protein